MKFLIVTALKAEATPLIQEFELSKDPSRHRYVNRNLALVVTGVGEKNAARSVKRTLESFPSTRDLMLVNIGIAGSPPGRAAIGKMIMVHKLTSATSGKSYFPDILVKHGLPEMELLTVEKGIIDGPGAIKSLVDMEGTGIFQAGSTYLPPHRIVFLKIVSDYMDCRDFKTLDVCDLVQKNLVAFKRILGLFAVSEFEDRRILTPEEVRFLEDQIKMKRFSVTQSLHLFELAENYVSRTKKRFTTVREIFRPNPTSKQDRNQLYHAICTYLSS